MASASFLLLAFSGVAFAALPATEPKQEEVSVTVYFESYCPDSVEFLTKQLYPVTMIPALMSHLNITLVPYGKATTTKSETGYTFDCHHGEKECHGNKVLACVLLDLENKQADFKEKLEFTKCTSSMIANNTKLEVYPTAECRSTNLDPAKIEKCAQGENGSEYLAKFGNITNELANPLSSVPTIVFNDKFVESEHMLALTNFKQAICNKLTTKPSECPTGNAATTLRLQAAILPVCAAIAFASRA